MPTLSYNLNCNVSVEYKLECSYTTQGCTHICTTQELRVRLAKEALAAMSHVAYIRFNTPYRDGVTKVKG